MQCYHEHFIRKAKENEVTISQNFVQFSSPWAPLDLSIHLKSDTKIMT